MNMRYLVILLIMSFPVFTIAQPAIDVHCHNLFPELAAFLKEQGEEMNENDPLPQWNVESHIDFMKKAGIVRSVVSMPAPQPFMGGVDESRRVVRRYNNACAQLKATYPDKFLFCASLPLPYVDAAIEEAVYAIDTLGADGIKLATNSYGQYVGDEVLDTLMSVLNERHAVVILHPHRPVSVNDSIIAVTPLAMYEYPAETTRAVVNMIVRNIPTRYPNIKFVIPHCGSFLQLAIPRMQVIYRAMEKNGVMEKINWRDNLKNFYYDLAGNPTVDVLRCLLSITTPEHLLYGSDYPYQSAEYLAEDLQHLRGILYGDTAWMKYAQDILYGNAARLFAVDKSNIVDSSSLENYGKQCVKLPMQENGIVRLSKIEVYPQYLEAYKQYAIEVGEISLRTEPGVLTMYALAEKENPCMITILETYSSQEAYKKHIASAHFQKYKQGTLHMVKKLVLSDQYPLNPSNRITNFIQH